MDSNFSDILQVFKNNVAIKFQLFNSLFISLPFHRIENTGVHLSLLLENCTEGYKQSASPKQIIETFFERYTTYENEKDKTDLLFRFIHYVERQVVLFDALEDSAYKEVIDINGPGTLKHLTSQIIQNSLQHKLAEKLKDFSVKLVLTAHPTQFYPGSVLGIINDLSMALKGNEISRVNMYLQQLAKTPFFNKEKPTPYDEAMSLLWFMENIFYAATGNMITDLKSQFPETMSDQHAIMGMGFWPGGDRDGNPNVNTATTLKVANALRSSIIKCYYRDIRRIKRRLTFKGVDSILAALEALLYTNIFVPGDQTEVTREKILEALEKAREITITEHNGLFVSLIENVINKVHVFGLHFATLDIRQESSVHNSLLELIASTEDVLSSDYALLNEQQKIDVLMNIKASADPEKYETGVLRDTLESVGAVKTIQQYNGEQGCNRYIISQCNSALNVLEVYGLFLLRGWKKEEMTVDIVPLFETVEDLQNATEIMSCLYENNIYRQHISKRNNTQTIMLGFSDGTKDGGYLMANWGIYKAKRELTQISKKYNVNVVFFDGRGGPPARGGGKSHKFYASMGKEVANKEIQLTIQGQTISTSYGSIESARFNMEQLLNAGISNELLSAKEKTLTDKEEKLLDDLAVESLQAYLDLKGHPEFMNYLSDVSPLKFYGETNIGSRPSKRGSSSKLTINDLRAIPFVGSWSQIKQNLTGYYGVGYAMQVLDKQGRLDEIKDLYKNSLFFKTLIDNCEMSMKKCFFPLTAYLATDAKYGEMWNRIHDEYELTKKYILEISGQGELMGNYPVEALSIQMREKIVLPLLTIQQYAMAIIRGLDERNATNEEKQIYQKLVMRCSFGIINAGRNSA
ncbi:phosphoenolpyruvate carboxylase [Segetibacter aerophilus]|uniref:Phosphoenolpyruvate carboxylase n=1 Tax=Segetibacter aerophilus TaxID=670293 RepID=A0A512BE21_9BACT|nr:phosphoenolpyruvate carboxylase [Segetibacter aerophilus]GEO10216.1 phosphoenolpyruvate carboxylase [Segetibacter aerophilus]